MDQFLQLMLYYKSYTISYLNQKEATKIAKNNLYKKSLHCFIEPPSHAKFYLSTVNKFKVISLSRQQLFVHILLSHGSRCYLPIQSFYFISLNKCLVICNNINCKASLNYFSATLKSVIFLLYNLEAIFPNFIPVNFSGHTVYHFFV